MIVCAFIRVAFYRRHTFFMHIFFLSYFLSNEFFTSKKRAREQKKKTNFILLNLGFLERALMFERSGARAQNKIRRELCKKINIYSISCFFFQIFSCCLFLLLKIKFGLFQQNILLVEIYHRPLSRKIFLDFCA